MAREFSKQSEGVDHARHYRLNITSIVKGDCSLLPGFLSGATFAPLANYAYHTLRPLPSSYNILKETLLTIAYVKE